MSLTKYSVKIDSVKVNNLEIAFTVEFTNENGSVLPSQSLIQNLNLNFDLSDFGSELYSQTLFFPQVNIDRFIIHKPISKPSVNITPNTELRVSVMLNNAECHLWNKSMNDYIYGMSYYAIEQVHGQIDRYSFPFPELPTY